MTGLDLAALAARFGPKVLRILAVIALLAGLIFAAHRWHGGRVDALVAAARKEQREADATAVAKAFAAATAERARLNAAIAARDAKIRETTDAALRHEQADNARRTADLGRLWRARRADPGRPGNADLPGPASAASLAADAACTAAGGIPFEPALAVVTDAENDAARLRAWQAWWAGVAAVDRK
ncbi:hypothetical protein [Sandarakinorhabdus sp. DWP1-3-1]|uniref:hypothetical protein n=1 Tax=Sandarakinorhabdus sp. DWP1-3-1 TaxID=2804627 RepID=UPI003CF1422A